MPRQPSPDFESKYMDESCSIDNCEEKILARGWCHKHYDRWYHHGNPIHTDIEMHGMFGTPEYRAWQNMKTRCLNSNYNGFANYGGRGIKVCDRWLNSFSAFYQDMGSVPEGMTLERKDVNGDYTPENCCWADRVTQSRNSRTRKDNTSGHRGIYRQNQKWQARISVKGKELRLGYYHNIQDAVKARITAEKLYWL